MTRLTVSSIALAAALALSLPLTGANAADRTSPMDESHLDAKDAYQNALTDCELLDNPDRRQECTDQAMAEYEKKIGGKTSDTDKEKSKY